ncbi:hypothetical protein BLOT_001320 [Blomia tropicalis]|nr:hypothetical protein BLOT_001320 [Blomia tropicalis]
MVQGPFRDMNESHCSNGLVIVIRPRLLNSSSENSYTFVRSTLGSNVKLLNNVQFKYICRHL